MASLTRPALSERLRIGPAGLLRLNAALGTCYPVDGVRCYGPIRSLDNLHFRTDPVALAAPAPEPEPTAPEPTPDLVAEAAAAETGMGWLLASAALLLSLTALFSALYHG